MHWSWSIQIMFFYLVIQLSKIQTHSNCICLFCTNECNCTCILGFILLQPKMSVFCESLSSHLLQVQFTFLCFSFHLRLRRPIRQKLKEKRFLFFSWSKIAIKTKRKEVSCLNENCFKASWLARPYHANINILSL